MKALPSAEVPDWSREQKRFFEWAPSKSLIASIRAYQHHASKRHLWSPWLRRCAVLRHRFWQVVTGADIPVNTSIAGGFVMIHPNGVVVHPASQIGPNCMLFQQVTLAGGEHAAPILQGHVDVGAGAKLIGDITLGKHVAVGANAVVLTDVPDHATAVGIPARIIRRREMP